MPLSLSPDGEDGLWAQDKPLTARALLTPHHPRPSLSSKASSSTANMAKTTSKAALSKDADVDGEGAMRDGAGGSRAAEMVDTGGSVDVFDPSPLSHRLELRSSGLFLMVDDGKAAQDESGPVSRLRKRKATVSESRGPSFHPSPLSGIQLRSDSVRSASGLCYRFLLLDLTLYFSLCDVLQPFTWEELALHDDV